VTIAIITTLYILRNIDLIMVSDDNSCKFFTLIVGFLALICVTTQYAVIYGNSLNYEETNCNIISVEYPVIDSIINNTDHFIKCSCGRRCTSTLGICNKIYVNDINSATNTKNLLIETYSSIQQLCTFSETSCPDAENFENRRYKITKNIERMKIYEDYKNNNVSLKCYHYNNVYFMNNNNYLKETIICSVLIGISLLFIIIILIAKCKGM